MPSIRRVPFLSVRAATVNPRQWRAGQVTLGLLDAGVIGLHPPEDGDRPLDYLLHAYLERHASCYPEGLHVSLDVPELWNEAPALQISTFQADTGLLNFARLERELSALHPALFGALIGKLRHQLSPYLPLFTAEDALMVAGITRFYEDWLGSVAEAYEDAHPEADMDRLSDETLLAWHQQQGGLTPEGMAALLPARLWQRNDALLGLLGTRKARAIPGVTGLRQLLRHLSNLNQERLDKREWTDNYLYFLHPGYCHVVVTGDPARDEVHELYHELQVNFTFDPEDALPLQTRAVRGAQDHQAWTAYLDDLCRVRRMAEAAFQAAQGD